MKPTCVRQVGTTPPGPWLLELGPATGGEPAGGELQLRRAGLDLLVDPLVAGVGEHPAAVALHVAVLVERRSAHRQPQLTQDDHVVERPDAFGRAAPAAR